MFLIILVMELYISGKLSGHSVVKWWSERGRDVYRSGKTISVTSQPQVTVDVTCIIRK